METPVDRRIIEAIVAAVHFEVGYAVRLDILTSIIKGSGKTEGEGYKLLGEFYDALNEGRLKGAYLIKLDNDIERGGILVVSPVELTNEQLKTLDTVVRWVEEVSSVRHLDTKYLVQSILDRLITLWTGEKYYRGARKFAINNGVTLESDSGDKGAGIPSLTAPNKTKEGEQGE
jgi:hypothetical protein